MEAKEKRISEKEKVNNDIKGSGLGRELGSEGATGFSDK